MKLFSSFSLPSKVLWEWDSSGRWWLKKRNSVFGPCCVPTDFGKTSTLKVTTPAPSIAPPTATVILQITTLHSKDINVVLDDMIRSAEDCDKSLAQVYLRKKNTCSLCGFPTTWLLFNLKSQWERATAPCCKLPNSSKRMTPEFCRLNLFGCWVTETSSLCNVSLRTFKQPLMTCSHRQKKTPQQTDLHPSG